MEKQKQLLLNAQKSIDEINSKMLEIKNLLTNKVPEDSTKKAENLLKQMEEIRDEITVQYNKVSELENENEKNLKKMELNIFNSIKSYKEAFSEAGGIFKVRK